ELLHVPFIVWAPGARSGRVESPVGLVDVTPTILDAVGLPPAGEMSGMSLWPSVTSRAAIPSRVLAAEYTCIGPERKAIIEWPHKLVFTDDGSPLQLINLADGANGKERIEADGAQPEVRERLLAELKRTFPGDSGGSHSKAVPLDAETRER